MLNQFFGILCVFCVMLVASKSNVAFANSLANSGSHRFGQSATPCANARIVASPLNVNIVFSFLQEEFHMWDVSQRRLLSQWNRGEVSGATDFVLVGNQKFVLVADKFGIALRDVFTGDSKAEWDYEFGLRNLKYYTLGVDASNRLGVATGLTGWPHKIPDSSALGVSSRELQEAKELQPQKMLVMDLENGVTIGSVEFSDSFVHTVKVNSDRSFAVTFSYLAITFWDIRDPSRIRSIKKINVSDLNDSLRTHEIIAGAAVSDDMRLGAVSTNQGVFILNLEQKTILSQINSQTDQGIRLIRYLIWSLDHTKLYGSDLQGRMISWSVAANAIQLQRYYSLGRSGNGAIIVSSSSDGSPHPAFVIDRTLKYYIRPAPLDNEATFGQCQGFELISL